MIFYKLTIVSFVKNLLYYIGFLLYLFYYTIIHSIIHSILLLYICKFSPIKINYTIKDDYNQ